MIKNNRGQATTEMMILFPILAMVLGGAVAVVYIGWQNVRAQQAANLAARVQGEERVQGAFEVQDIQALNGVGPNTGGDDDPTQTTDPQHKRPPANSVYGKYYRLVKNFFGRFGDQVFIPPPVIGQNVDEVDVVRTIDLPDLRVPGMQWQQKQLQLQAKAWGGEDTYMYGLPRWGADKSGGTPVWKKLIQESANNANAPSGSIP